MAGRNTTIDLVTSDPDAIPSEDKSIQSLIPPGLREVYESSKKRSPQYFNINEKELFQELCKDHKKPAIVDNALRIRFWQEYDRAVTTDSKFVFASVLHGVMTPATFAQWFHDYPHKIAWLFCPPLSYTTYIEEALLYGLSQLRDILEISHEDGNGKIDLKLMELKAKIVFMLDQRAKGSFIQRSEQKNLHLNVRTTTGQVAQAALENSMEEIERKLEQLEKRERKALNMPDQKTEIEVESESV